MDYKSSPQSRHSPLATRASKVGIAGLGAIGSAVARALVKGIAGYELVAASEASPPQEFHAPLVDFKELAQACDLVIECLPPYVAPALAQEVLGSNKNMILLSSSSLLLYPEIMDHLRASKGRIIVPSGAICGLDGVRALAQTGIKRSKIASTKPPKGYAGAPYVIEKNIDLGAITKKQKIFSGNARQAAMAFPANVNVAATLSLAGIGPERTEVEIWADPEAKGNAHEITVEGAYSVIRARVDNISDPANPRTSMLAAQSVIAVLKGLTEPLAVL